MNMATFNFCGLIACCFLGAAIIALSIRDAVLNIRKARKLFDEADGRQGMNSKRQRVELHPAHLWTCEQCGRDNFERSIDYEFKDVDDRAEVFRRFHHMDQFEELPEGWESFGVVTAPDEVTCRHCSAEFETERQECPGGGDEDGEHG